MVIVLANFEVCIFSGANFIFCAIATNNVSSKQCCVIHVEWPCRVVKTNRVLRLKNNRAFCVCLYTLACKHVSCARITCVRKISSPVCTTGQQFSQSVFEQTSKKLQSLIMIQPDQLLSRSRELNPAHRFVGICLLAVSVIRQLVYYLYIVGTAMV